MIRPGRAIEGTNVVELTFLDGTPSWVNPDDLMRDLGMVAHWDCEAIQSSLDKWSGVPYTEHPEWEISLRLECAYWTPVRDRSNPVGYEVRIRVATVVTPTEEARLRYFNQGKRGPGRPRKGSAARSKEIKVGVTEVELAQVREQAAQSGQSMSEWCRERIGLGS